ncbi:hypothetical protein IGI37_001696 [Enterococcus sp. AZ194]|uniref:hypothetical protein n=1 Tax=Enterococcus sp. AZ194 TaxID=2774629 RepID=UPI003F210E5A
MEKETKIPLLKKSYPLVVGSVSGLIVLASVVAIIGSLLQGLTNPVFVFVFFILFGVTGVFYSYQTFLMVYKEQESKQLRMTVNCFAIITFTYMAFLSAYLYVFENEAGALKLIIIGVLAMVGSIINFRLAKKA